MSIKTVNDISFKSEVLDQDLVLVDFSAEWCKPCVVQHEILSKFANQNPDIKIVEVNVDDSPEVAKEFKIKAMPTLLVFKNSEVVAKKVGLTSGLDLEKLITSA